MNAQGISRNLRKTILVPVLVALVAATWLLWTRQEPSRQGGYCMNATIEIAGALRRADDSGDLAKGPLPPIDKIFAQVPRVHAERFTVNTPPEVSDQVAALVADGNVDAFAAIVADYLVRCRVAST